MAEPLADLGLQYTGVARGRGAHAASELASAGSGAAREHAVVLGVIALAAVLSLASPLALLLFGPILLGVPHVIGDVRTLLLQRPGELGGAGALACLAPLAAMTALRAAGLAGASLPSELELACGALAVLLAARAGARDPRTRRAWSIGCAALGLVAVGAPRATLLTLAHAHNLVALGLWVAWAPRGAGRRAVVVAYALALLVVVALPHASGEALGTFRWQSLARDLAPGLEAGLADAVVRSFAFAQLVHYGLWCWSLPRARRNGAGARHLGLATLAILACVAVPALGWLDPVETRSAYLSLAAAHGWLELAVIAYLLARRSGGARA